MEIVAHSLRAVFNNKKHMKRKDLAMLKFDFKNAFNLVTRAVFMHEVRSMFPTMTAWTNWCYDTPALLLYAFCEEFLSEEGVQQGDPLGPLYFCCALLKLVDKLQTLDPLYHKWYLDDGGIVADKDTLLKAWKMVTDEGPALGLHLNRDKCEWTWLNPDNQEACPIQGVKLVPRHQADMLGVPLGDEEHSNEYVGPSWRSTPRP